MTMKAPCATNMTGTLFDTGMNSPSKPVQIGTVTIAGTILHVAVYPQRVSRRGRLVHDIRLHYPPAESGRLVRTDPLG